MTNKQLPRLELTENPNKNNEFIIFRKQLKDKKSSHKKITKKRKHNNRKTVKKKKKSLFNLF